VRALRYKARLIEHLAHESYLPATPDELVDELRIDDPAVFAEEVGALVELGEVESDEKGRIHLPGLDPDGGELVGTFRGTSRGFGFVQPEVRYREGDIFIPERLTGDALSGDTVRIEYRRERRREKYGSFTERQYSGAVAEVLERKRSAFVGELFRQGGRWLVQPDGKVLDSPIIVRDAESKNAKVGLKVAVEILEYPEGDELAEGVITRVLGEAGEPDVETQAVIAAYGLPSNEFPEACVDQAREVTRAFEEAIERFERGETLEGRMDLTGLHGSDEARFICTIDPPDAKDYDDAISIVRSDKGWELGVHIADVGYFIEQDTALDEEAEKRGNSVYLPRLVIPMLPELLSNGICSLQEGVCRFAKTAFMSYDRHGNVKASGVASTIIRSAKRLTYLEAQALIDGDIEEAKAHARAEPVYSKELIATLKEMDALARAIQARRKRHGMISLELPDVELIFDEDGRVIDAEREDDAFTHTIIEMFMVEANEALARLFEQVKVPLLRRTHPEPTPGEAEDLQRAAKVAGYTIPKYPTREEMQGLLDATRGTPASRAVHMAVLRTLTKAVYSPALVGHFALASEAYAHFTSPIRRYPDLTVHRSLGEYLRLTDNGQNRPHANDDAGRARLGSKLRDSELCPSESDLSAIGRHCTQTEQNAEDAERQLRQFLVLQLMAEKIGEEMGGVVTGVTARGLYVQIDKYLADGMIKVEDLPGDVTRGGGAPKWRIDKKTGALVDANSGRSFNMGDLVRVRIAEVDLGKRRLDLVIADAEGRAAGKPKTPKLNLGGGGGGLDEVKGAGFKTPGATRRSRKSKQRDRGKTDHRRDRKKR